MMSEYFWDVATSYFALGCDGLLLLAALVVGFVPFGRYMPVIGPYVPAARLVAVFLALLMAFLIGFRIADERETAKALRATIAAQSADLRNTAKAASDAEIRANAIEKDANAQRKADDEYIAALKLSAGCGFEPFARRVPNGSGAGASGAKPAAGGR